MSTLLELLLHLQFLKKWFAQNSPYTKEACFGSGTFGYPSRKEKNIISGGTLKQKKSEFFVWFWSFLTSIKEPALSVADNPVSSCGLPTLNPAWPANVSIFPGLKVTPYKYRSDGDFFSFLACWWHCVVFKRLQSANSRVCTDNHFLIF